MKTDTQILNEIAAESPYLHKLTEEESAMLKQMLLKIYGDIADVCEKNNLTFMLGGGTCLGAVRHKGFIPWDDDFDLMMPREDYEKLVRLCSEGMMGPLYEFTYPSKEIDSKNAFLKIYRKGTVDNELCNENAPFPKGISIDIFPMDYAPDNALIRRLKGDVSDVLMAISSSVLYAQYPSEKYRQFACSSPESKKRFQLRMMIGNVMKLIPHKTWVYWFDKLNSRAKKSNLMTIPTGRKHYAGEIQTISTFLPVTFGDFEGRSVPLPNDWDKYLSALYGNYMQLPPEEKRERHFVYQFQCSE